MQLLAILVHLFGNAFNEVEPGGNASALVEPGGIDGAEFSGLRDRLF